MILDGIVGATRQGLGNQRPLASMKFELLFNDTVLFIAPISLLDVGVQMIVPAIDE